MLPAFFLDFPGRLFYSGWVNTFMSGQRLAGPACTSLSRSPRDGVRAAHCLSSGAALLPGWERRAVGRRLHPLPAPGSAGGGAGNAVAVSSSVPVLCPSAWTSDPAPSLSVSAPRAGLAPVTAPRLARLLSGPSLSRRSSCTALRTRGLGLSPRRCSCVGCLAPCTRRAPARLPELLLPESWPPSRPPAGPGPPPSCPGAVTASEEPSLRTYGPSKTPKPFVLSGPCFLVAAVPSGGPFVHLRTRTLEHGSHGTGTLHVQRTPVPGERQGCDYPLTFWPGNLCKRPGRR